jgi:glycine betaine/choline ABC-type transport system substrate-binding protein
MSAMRHARVLGSIAILLLVACSKQKLVVVGSKNFTESVLLGEIVAQRLERAGCAVERKLDLGGTLVCDKAITAGSLDVYPEYSGTALTAILHHEAMRDRTAVMKRVAADYGARGLSWGPALGFENTFAMIVRTSDAQRFSLKTISDLTRVSATFRPGFGYEFVERPDGWNGLLRQYGLHFAETPRTMDLGLTYRALAAGEIDLIAGNSTDGLIEALALTVLADDRHFFPPYDAALAVRRDLGTKCAAGPAALASLEGRLDASTMRRLNLAIDRDKRSPSEVARTWLKDK